MPLHPERFAALRATRRRLVLVALLGVARSFFCMPRSTAGADFRLPIASREATKPLAGREAPHRAKEQQADEHRCEDLARLQPQQGRLPLPRSRFAFPASGAGAEKGATVAMMMFMLMMVISVMITVMTTTTTMMPLLMMMLMVCMQIMLMTVMNCSVDDDDDDDDFYWGI